MTGTLYLVATPIGNLADLSLRAGKILGEVTCILAEDTRVSGKLLKEYHISTPVRAYHDHNKERVTDSFIERLCSGDSLALITDAGTPGIADPAFYIVRKALQNNITVSPIPGPTAAISALIASGLPTDRFLFENFLPPKSAKRKQFFSSMAAEKRTVIFYESPHRIMKVLDELDQLLPDAAVTIAREITKRHEEFLRGTPEQIITTIGQRKLKGELVVLFNTQFRDRANIFTP
ncbi:16S rRNA (cytidine(1402)-2'-O)-methyltransferase [Chitinivibrio alkaliphilus]|uniref:Ribosomal RNA small subunit methyltransferase I n=1 Tax=Chitinivibrio alkaliphilus ACht1 TaxID=1313304 RepID=U7DA02_9BACT|nr:16S rRNA (cytidine(1402)-2'-O)-methyltransferase [Chitinivibrio alkaliphilus]ERP31255.1 Uroporphyrin-III C/tetrapyrrole (Corrin/Porphyrin) methyltransferase [Chitinivibrio alkaliphilus ACht1]